MNVPEPYIHIVDDQETAVETGLFAEGGAVYDWQAGYHAIFAGVVLRRPFEEVMQRVWSFIELDKLVEIYDRQVAFIKAFHTEPGLPIDDAGPNPALYTLELRFLAQPDSDFVEVALLGKVFASDASTAEEQAWTLWSDVYASFPSDHLLVPARSPEIFEALYQGEMIRGITDARQIVEIRRYEEFLPIERASEARWDHYVVYPFVWHPHSLTSAWTAMALCSQEVILSVSLRPTRLYEAEEVYLRHLHAAMLGLGTEEHPQLRLQSELAAQLYGEYLLRLRRPCLLRVCLISDRPVPSGIARTLGVGLTHPPLDARGPSPLPTVGFESVSPRMGDRNDLVTAQRNLLLLEQDPWGCDFAHGPLHRLRYLVDAQSAHCAFRLPCPPRGGYPDFVVGGEVAPAPSVDIDGVG